jgi:hypothetical protein
VAELRTFGGWFGGASCLNQRDSHEEQRLPPRDLSFEIVFYQEEAGQKPVAEFLRGLRRSPVLANRIRSESKSSRMGAITDPQTRKRLAEIFLRVARAGGRRRARLVFLHGESPGYRRPCIPKEVTTDAHR